MNIGIAISRKIPTEFTSTLYLPLTIIKQVIPRRKDTSTYANLYMG